MLKQRNDEDKNNIHKDNTKFVTQINFLHFIAI